MLRLTLPPMGPQVSRAPPNRSCPEAWPLERGKWEAIVATDEKTLSVDRERIRVFPKVLDAAGNARKLLRSYNVGSPEVRSHSLPESLKRDE
jgi:hypothetical protein